MSKRNIQAAMPASPATQTKVRNPNPDVSVFTPTTSQSCPKAKPESSTPATMSTACQRATSPVASAPSAPSPNTTTQGTATTISSGKAAQSPALRSKRMVAPTANSTPPSIRSQSPRASGRIACAIPARRLPATADGIVVSAAADAVHGAGERHRVDAPAAVLAERDELRDVKAAATGGRARPLEEGEAQRRLAEVAVDIAAVVARAAQRRVADHVAADDRAEAAALVVVDHRRHMARRPAALVAVAALEGVPAE